MNIQIPASHHVAYLIEQADAWGHELTQGNRRILSIVEKLESGQTWSQISEAMGLSRGRPKQIFETAWRRLFWIDRFIKRQAENDKGLLLGQIIPEQYQCVRVTKRLVKPGWTQGMGSYTVNHPSKFAYDVKHFCPECREVLLASMDNRKAAQAYADGFIKGLAQHD